MSLQCSYIPFCEMICIAIVISCSPDPLCDKREFYAVRWSLFYSTFCFMEILWRWIRASRLLVLDMRSGDETTFFHFFHFFRIGVTFNMKIPVEGKLQFTACFANYIIALSLVSHEPFSPFITPHVMYKDFYFLIHHESFRITQHTS